MKTLLDTGCHIIANAVKCANVDVVAAYPITPQTSVVEEISEMVEKGEMDCRFLPVEGEHSAMAACVAASATGARTFTATSSQGLLYMHEVLHMASGGRLPIVMANVNRAVFAPWSIWVDHQDSVSQRDTGWLQFYCSSLQEAFDTIIQAFKIAERTSIPAMVNIDGFILSHCTMPIKVPDQDIIDRFLSTFEPGWTLDPDDPNTFAGVTPPEAYSHYRQLLSEDILASTSVIAEAAEEYRELTGLWHGGLLDTYLTEDADVFVLAMGSMADELRLSVDQLRREGVKAGLIRLRVFRPFPAQSLSELLPAQSKLVVLDRSYAFGWAGGTLYNEVRNALYDRDQEIMIKNEVMGIGGTDLTGEYMAERIKELLK